MKIRVDADDAIVSRLKAGDPGITADIPLSPAVIEAAGHALDTRGEFFTKDNIQGYLSMRTSMDELRSSGIETGGPAPLNQGDRQSFANQLDRFLLLHAKHYRAARSEGAA